MSNETKFDRVYSSNMEKKQQAKRISTTSKDTMPCESTQGQEVSNPSGHGMLSKSAGNPQLSGRPSTDWKRQHPRLCRWSVDDNLAITNILVWYCRTVHSRCIEHCEIISTYGLRLLQNTLQGLPNAGDRILRLSIGKGFVNT